jgi:predicted PurR-regulated permease PerM
VEGVQVLLAVILQTAANGLSRWTNLRSTWSLTLVIELALGVVGVGSWLAAPRVAKQTQALQENLSKSIETLTRQIDDLWGGDEVVENQPASLVRLTGELTIGHSPHRALSDHGDGAVGHRALPISGRALPISSRVGLAGL